MWNDKALITEIPAQRKEGPPQPIGRPLARFDGGWRAILPVHPAAELLPLVQGDDLSGLVGDIAVNGLRDKVDLYYDRDGKAWLLDGRNRLDALESLGEDLFDDKGKLRAEFQNFPPPKLLTEADCVLFVISKNIHRRHLTNQQKRDLVAKLLKEKPEASNRQIAKQVRVDHKTVAKVREQNEGRGEIPHVETRTDTKGRKQPVNPRGLTEKSRLGNFERLIDGCLRTCDRTESALTEKEFMPARLTDEQRAEATRQLTESISYLQRALKLVAKMERAP
jgi:hypothetical protein